MSKYRKGSKNRKSLKIEGAKNRKRNLKIDTSKNMSYY